MSHYEIRDEIGRGGMGVVYQAHDTKLNRTVALKFLPRTLHGDETAHKRFIAEARTASGLDHPNICTIYEIGETEDGATFIAMAYYPGETLQEKIAKGPMEPDEALDYAIQVARGLSKAHDAGITHRDMKPANCIVTDDGILKILDFGLARVEDQQLTRTGELLGTLSYMAPEQVEGTTADARSDVWSAGAMYYEMLTGKAPFPGANQAAVLYAVMHTEPDDVSDANESVSPDTARLVSRCLKKDQTRRFADAGQLLEALERLQAPKMRGVAPAGTAPRRPARTKEPRPSRRLVAAGATFGVATLLALIPTTRAFVVGLFGPPSAMANSPMLLAVVPIQSGGVENQIRAEGLANALSWELSQLGGDDSLLVLPASEVLNLDIRTAQRLRELYGVDRVLNVAVDASGVSIELGDASTPTTRSLNRAMLPLPDAETFLDTLPIVLASLLDLGGDPTPGRTQPRGTAIAAAYDLYTNGRGYLTRYDLPRNLEFAAQLFQEAVDLDPEYAAAYAGLCETRFEQFRRTNVSSFADLGRQNCLDAHRLGANQSAVLTSVGAVYLQTGQPQVALDILEASLALDDENAETQRWLGRVYEEIGPQAAAEEAYREAIRLNSRVWVYYSHLASFYASWGQIDEALETYDQIDQVSPDNELGRIGKAGALIYAGRADEAESILRPISTRFAHPRIWSNLGYVDFQRGNFDAAVQTLERGVAEFGTDLPTWRWLALAHAQLGNTDEAEAAWQQVINLALPRLLVDPTWDDGIDVVAEAYAGLGEGSSARDYLQRLNNEPVLKHYQRFQMARTYLMLGETDQALQSLRDALGQGFAPAFVETDPWFQAVLDDPAFRTALDEATD